MKNFTREELQCPCCGDCKIDPEAGAKLQKLRDILGFPLQISSGYRCEDHNMVLKGGSTHPKGIAFDIKTTPLTPKQKHSLIKEGSQIFGAVGAYNSHVHFDDRKTKEAFWVGISK